MSNLWDQLVDCICRPPRDVYSPHELLGGSAQTFMVGSMEATRLDFELVNKAGEKMLCSHYLPLDARGKDGKLPVVIYCHCNSGSRRDAEEAVWHLLPCGVGVVAFDFTGSGLSDGKWVTLGAHEVDDLAAVVQHLRAQGGVSSVGLWGRSMGAVTALLYSQKDPDIAGMVLDSPFSKLTDLMLEIVVSQRLPIPRVMLRLALKLMRSSVKRKAGADINAVSPLDVVGRSLIPAMFGHGEQDSFIDIQHSVKLHQAYNALAAAEGCLVYKNLVRFKGDHNHPRPAFFYSSVCCFFHQQLKLDEVLVGGNPADAQQLLRHGSLNMAGEPPEQVDRANGFINTPWSLDGMTQLGDLTPEQQQAAAAALMLESGGNDAAAAAAGAAQGGSNGGSRGYNPRAVVDGNAVQRAVAATAAAAAAAEGASSGRRVHHSPTAGQQAMSSLFGTGQDMVVMSQQQQQQQQRQTMMSVTPAVMINSSSRGGGEGAELEPDLFEVGSRGCLHTVPLLAAEDADSDGPLGSPAALSTGSHGNSSSSSIRGIVPLPWSAAGVAGAGQAAGESTSNSSSEGGLLGPLGKLLRRSGGSHGHNNSNQNSIAGVAGSAAGGSDGDALTVQQQQQQTMVRSVQSPGADAAEATAATSPTATAGWLGAVATADSPGACGAGGVNAPQTGRRWPSDVAIWATARDDSDPMLAAAIAASLQDQYQQQQQQHNGQAPEIAGPLAAAAATAGGGGGAAAAVEQPPLQQQQQQPQQQQQQRHGAPVTAAEEEEMLRKAIQLSLAEASPQQQQQQQQVADDACEAVIVQLSQQHKAPGANDSVPAGSTL